MPPAVLRRVTRELPSRAADASLPRLVIRNARIATCSVESGDSKARLAVIDHGAIVVEGGRIVWLGHDASCPALDGAHRRIDAQRRLVTPGLVDPHTHLVFAGSRAAEFTKKMNGVDYRAIAAEGGGIMASVRATRLATDETLLLTALARLRVMLERGVTTVEVKSGYGLTLHDELRILRVARDASERALVDEDAPAHRRALPTPRTTTTLLGAHAVPPEFADDRAGYVRLVAHEMVAAAASSQRVDGVDGVDGDEQGDATHTQLADACDVYLDENAFTADEACSILVRASDEGKRLHVRAHVGQFADIGGAERIAELRGLSCDHLEHVSEAGLRAMAKAQTRAVLLPGAWRTLRQKAADAARMRAHGVRVAVGTDFNPGTSPTADLPMMAALAVRDAGLPADEALLSITAEAARACGVRDAGLLIEGGRADVVLWDHDDPLVFAYALGAVRPSLVLVGGVVALDEGMRAAIIA